MSHVLLLWHGTLIGILNASLGKYLSAYAIQWSAVVLLPFSTGIASVCSYSFT